MAGRKRRIVALFGPPLLICAGSLLAATPRAAQIAPILVPVEFRVDRGGVPVTDLQAGDVAVRVASAEADVRAFDRVNSDRVRPPPFATNLALPRSRDWILALDEESFQIGGESRLRDAVSAIVQEMTPRDRVGFISLHPSGAAIAVTGSRATAQAAVTQLRGRSLGPESGTDLTCRTRRLLPVLSNLMKSLDSGVTTTVIVVSAAFAAPAAATVPRSGAEVGCLLVANDFDEFRAAAARSAARLHAIHLADSASTQLDPRLGAGLERLAGEAAGQFSRVAGDPAPAMKKIAADLATYYVATIALDAALAGSKQTVDIRVRREGVTTHYKPEITVPPIESRTVSPRDMLRVAAPHRALPLRAAAFPSRDAGRQAKLVVLFEPVDPSVTLATAAAGLFNEKGQLVAQWNGEKDELAGRPAMAGLVAPPGSYRLRIAAVDSKGRSGSVDDDVRVDVDAAGGATTSAVVLGVPREVGFTPRLQFGSSDAAAAVYLEVYGVKPCSSVSAILELATADQGPLLGRGPATSTEVPESDTCILFGGFDLSAVPAGDHTIRVQLQIKGEAAGQRVRTLRKTSR